MSDQNNNSSQSQHELPFVSQCQSVRDITRVREDPAPLRELHYLRDYFITFLISQYITIDTQNSRHSKYRFDRVNRFLYKDEDLSLEKCVVLNSVHGSSYIIKDFKAV